MPGILKRSHDRMDSTGELDAGAGAPDKKRQALDGGATGGQDRANGNNNTSSSLSRTHNGLETGSGGGTSGGPHASDEALDTALSAIMDSSDEPPEIFHITGSYIPLSTLVERLSQETFIELEALVSELSEMQSHQVNGYGSSKSMDINVQKKEKLWGFAGGFRAKFIKLLVLSQWSRQSEAVSKVIDINAWIVQQKELYRNATTWMGELKRMLSDAKFPAADLPNILEMLSTGKAERYSHLGYFPPEPYTPKQLLHSLRTINTLLHVRLNLHEDVPPEMIDFSIASGRATFRVKDEFELDVSIADEDSSSQLYFIDFRFSFSPCMKELPEGPLRNHIEGKTNEILRTKGLTGCYEYLHEFILTHKLNILRNQAWDLARGQWSENIKVEPVRRSVVIHYWTNRPGGKSWIEIGTRKRRRNSFASSRQVSHLAVRWHRHGKEVVEHDIEVDPAELSAESILKEAIAEHTNHIFKETKRSLKSSFVYSQGELTVKHRAHPTEPAECSLRMQVSQSLSATITQEPMSGYFAVSPSSGVHYRAEQNLNRLRDPAAEMAAKLALMRCTETLDHIKAKARMRRWQAVQNVTPNQETTGKFFGKGILRLAFYKLPKWSKDWILAITAGPSGDQWWAVETQELPRKIVHSFNIGTDAFQPIKKTLKLKVKTIPAAVFDPSNSSLSLVEHVAAAVVSQFVTARSLTRFKIPYKQMPPQSSLPNITVPDLFILFSPTWATSRPPGKGKDKEQVPWCRDTVKITYLGLSRSQAFTTSVVSARLRHKIPDIHRLASTTKDTGLAFNSESGDFSFRLRTPLGESCVDEMKSRFDRIASLIQLTSLAARSGLTCSYMSLDRVTIIYAPSFSAGASTDHGGDNSTSHSLLMTSQTSSKTDSLSVTIHFPPNERMRLSFTKGNPHIRIVDFLNLILNENDQDLPLDASKTISSAADRAPLISINDASAVESHFEKSKDKMQGLRHVLFLLVKTLPLLRGFEAIERLPPPKVAAAAGPSADSTSASKTDSSPTPSSATFVALNILPRSATCFRVRYSAAPTPLLPLLLPQPHPPSANPKSSDTNPNNRTSDTKQKPTTPTPELVPIRLSLEFRLRRRAGEPDNLVWFASLVNDLPPVVAMASQQAAVAAQAAAASSSSSSAKSGQSSGDKDTAAGGSENKVAIANAGLVRDAYSLLRREWATLIKDGRGEGWYGLGAGILCATDAAEGCMVTIGKGIAGAVREARDVVSAASVGPTAMSPAGAAENKAGGSGSGIGAVERGQPGGTKKEGTGKKGDAPSTISAPGPKAGGGQGPAKTAQMMPGGGGGAGGKNQAQAKKKGQEIITLD